MQKEPPSRFEPGTLQLLTPHTPNFFFCIIFWGFSGGEACNCEWQHAMNALSAVAEAQSGTAMSRCFF